MNEETARQPAVVRVNGLDMAVLSYNAAALSEAFPADAVTPGVALAEVASIQQDVRRARANADIVVVSLHTGVEYADLPTNEQITLP